MKVYKCESVVDFWSLVAPSGELFSNPTKRYIFRGQSDASWKLMPSVYRPDVLDRYKGSVNAVYKDHVGQTLLEWSLLDSFVHYCDQHGLPIADDGHLFRQAFSFQTVMAVNGHNNRQWPQPHIHALMALAQHHGVPTRLLDWSRSSLIACYFAAAGALKGATKVGEIAVFAMSYNPHRLIDGYKHISVPGSTSPNIAAQKGTFLLIDNTGYRGVDFTPGVCLEEKIAPQDELLKFTLPSHLAGELLSHCELYDVSAASVFPGYNGAAQAVNEWILRQRD